MARIDYWHTRCPYLGIRKIVTKLQKEGFSIFSSDYKELLRGLNIRQSMDGRSRWTGNIMIKRWLSGLLAVLLLKIVLLNDMLKILTSGLDKGPSI